MSKFPIPSYEIEYSEKSLSIEIYEDYSLDEVISFEGDVASEYYDILMSDNREKIRNLFEDIYNEREV
tara:strand:- start:129 stop:332 length:204 start_codon:yes stop_codon:yes gene_type:complete